MNNKFKKICILFIMLIVLATPVLFANAQEGLVTCGRNIDNDPKTILSGEEECSLCHLFVLAQNVTDFLTFTIAPTLAILVIAYGGFNIFLAGASPDKVKTGRNAITKAAVGLLIVFGAWMAINEVLLFLSQQTSSVAEIKTATGKFNPWTDITCSTKTLPASPIKPAPGVTPTTTGTWGNDDAIRKTLKLDGFTINHENCINIGDKDCTSVYGLSDTVRQGLRDLKTYTGYDPKASITITGGTEYWLHGSNTEHKPGGKVIDLSSKDALLNQYIRGQKKASSYDKDNYVKNYKVKKTTSLERQKDPPYCSTLGDEGYEFYIPQPQFCNSFGECTDVPDKRIAIYVLENIDVPEHWHACYYASH